MTAILVLRWLTLIGLLFWFVAYWRGGQKIVADLQASVVGGGSFADRMAILAIALSSFGIAATGLLLVFGVHLESGTPPLWLVLGGWLLSVVGIVGTFACRRYLGRFFTADTRLVPEHQVVDQGPYGVVRHPIYSFAILLYIGLGLVFPTWWDLLLTAVIVGSYLLKATIEDDFLEAHLTGYKEYKQRVRQRVIPWVW